MTHLRSIESARLAACSLTIGAFDGVHRGHQKLVRETVGGAREAGIPAVVLTFFPHPSVVLQDRQPSFYLTTPEQKADLLLDLGIETVITEEFNRELSERSAQDFLGTLAAHLGFRQLWVGPDFALGHQREGNIPYLQAAQRTHNFELRVVEPLTISGEIISSSRIRETLRAGDVARAADYLGRYFALTGMVQRGAGRGKGLGIPTANLDIWDQSAYPREGVYACTAWDHSGNGWMAVTNVGRRPTFDDQLEQPVVETHLLDFEGDLYDQQLTLQFVDRLRDEVRFDSVDELLTQIGADIDAARDVLGSEGVVP